MGSIEVFTNQTQVFITFLALGILFLACVYSTVGEDKFFSPLWLFFIGLVLDLGANGVAASASSVYTQGESINFYVFAELLLSLASMLFMVLSAISFIVNSNVMFWMSLALGVLGLIAVGLFVFLVPDGDAVNGMRLVFPMAGVTSVAIGFWGQVRGKNKGGFIVSALVMSIVLVFLLLRFVGVDVGSFIYVTIGSYILLAISLIMIKADILSQKNNKYEFEIANYNQKIKEIIRLSPFPIIISRLGDDKILMANNNAFKLFGINPQELDRYRFKDFFADLDNRHLLSERLETEREVQDFEVLIKTPYTAVPFWLLASANIIDYNYEPVLYTAFQDITSRKNRETMLQNQALRDPLTSIYNRRYFEEEVSRRIILAKNNSQPYSILMLDADYFKKVNDTYGHKTGDKVLIELASAIEHALRDNDVVARYGGEEFVVYLSDSSAQQGAIVAERLRQSIEKIVVVSDNNQEVKFTVSVGVSSSEISDSLDVLIKTADEALYRAKQNGRNRVEVFSPDHLKEFDVASFIEHKSEASNQHPVFDKENFEEISLLDGNPVVPQNLYFEDKDKTDDLS